MYIVYASLSKIQQEFICKPHAVLGQGVLIFQTTASNYMNEDIAHSFLVPYACLMMWILVPETVGVYLSTTVFLKVRL